MQSCCSLIASASAAAPRLRPFQLLLATCVCFSCCSPLASASAAAPDCVRFGCCSPIASASTTAPRLRPLQLLLARLRPLRLLLPDCMHPLAAPAGFQPIPAPGPNVLEHSSRSSRFSKLKHEGRASLV